MTKTKSFDDINMTQDKVGYKFTTKFDFYFKDGGTKYYIDNIGKDGTHTKVTDFRIRNSKTGQSQIMLVSDLFNGRYKDSYFFSN